MGIVGHDDDITDYSPDGVAARVDAARSALRELDGTTAADEVDHVTIAAMRERLGLQIELHDARSGCRRSERDRVAAAVDARRVRPDGHRHRRGLGADRPADVEGARPGRRLRRGTARGGGGRACARGPAGHPWHRPGRPDPAAVCRHGGRRGAGKRCAARGTATARRRCRRRLRHARRGAARRDRTARPA